MVRDNKGEGSFPNHSNVPFYVCHRSSDVGLFPAMDIAYQHLELRWDWDTEVLLGSMRHLEGLAAAMSQLPAKKYI
jgi:hypothetical protein